MTYQQLILDRMRQYHTTCDVVELAARVFWGEPEEFEEEREEARSHGASTLEDYMRYFASRAISERKAQ